MFSTFRKLFGKRGEEKTETSTLEAPPTIQMQMPPVTQPPPSRMRVDLQSRAPRTEPAPSYPAATPAPANSSAAFGLPLRSVIARLPAELMERFLQVDVGEAEIFIPAQKVLAQLPSGAVRISFGELRQAAPPGTFSPENDRDRALVDLPLQEILARMGANGLGRRSTQKRIEVPAEVSGPFGGQNRITISDPPKAPAPARRAPQQQQSHQHQHAQPAEEPFFKRNDAPVGQPAPAYAAAAPSPAYANHAANPIARNAPVQNRAYPPATQVKPGLVPDEPILKRAPVARPQSPAFTPPATPAPEEPIFRRHNAPIPGPIPVEETAPEEPIFNRAAPQSPVPFGTPIAPEPAQAIPFGEPSVIPAPTSLRGLTPTPKAPSAPAVSPPSKGEPEPIRFNPSFAPLQPAAAPAPAAPAQAQAPAAAPKPVPRETVFLNVSLADLAETWPDPIKQEIMALGALGASVALPQGMVDTAIKQGKIVFPWKLVRAWVKPPLSPAHVSPEDATMLELPLKVVTPAFMGNLRTGRNQKKISLDASIPDLFSGSPPPEAPAAPAAAPAHTPAPVHTPVHAPVQAHAPVAPPAPVVLPSPVPPPFQPHAPAAAAQSTDTNYYTWKENGAAAAAPVEEPAPLFKKGASPGTSFLQRYATPNEIVAKAASLNGVGGALIALPDGLLVASKIPSDMNADTLAAFLPQIFGRVSQSTRELRMGDLNNLNFTVGLIPWKIFRVGAIYFAAFGIAGQALPTAQLAGIAAELDRKAK